MNAHLITMEFWWVESEFICSMHSREVCVQGPTMNSCILLRQKKYSISVSFLASNKILVFAPELLSG